MSNGLTLTECVLLHASRGVVKDGLQLYDLDFVAEGPVENRSIGIRGYDQDPSMFVLGESYRFLIRQIPKGYKVKPDDPDIYEVSSISFVDEERRAYTIEMTRFGVMGKTSYHVDLLLDNIPTDEFLVNLNDGFFVSIQPSVESFRKLSENIDRALAEGIEKAKKPNCTSEDLAEIISTVKSAYGALENLESVRTRMTKELNDSLKPYMIDAHLPLEERISQTITALYQKHDCEETPEVFVGLFDTEGKGNKNLQVEFKYTDDRRDSLILNILLSEFQPSSGADSVIAETLFALATSWHKLQGTSGIKEISIQDMRPYGAITDNCRYMIRDFCRSVCSHLTMEEQKEIRNEFLEKHPYLELEVKEEQVLSEVITDYIGDERFVKPEEPTPMASDLSDLVRQKINRKGKRK